MAAGAVEAVEAAAAAAGWDDILPEEHRDHGENVLNESVRHKLNLAHLTSSVARFGEISPIYK